MILKHQNGEGKPEKTHDEDWNFTRDQEDQLKGRSEKDEVITSMEGFNDVQKKDICNMHIFAEEFRYLFFIKKLQIKSVMKDHDPSKS
jgi:hypothetical protein